MKIFRLLFGACCLLLSTAAPVRDFCQEPIFGTVFAELCQAHEHCVNEADRARCVLNSDSEYYCSLTLFGQSASSLCNSGKCLGSKEGITCICPPGLSGDQCTEKTTFLDFCSMSFAGVKGTDKCGKNGECKNTDRGTECQCNQDYSGDTCQTAKSTTIGLIGITAKHMQNLSAPTPTGELFFPSNTSANRISEHLSIGRVQYVAGVVGSSIFSMFSSDYDFADPKKLLVVGGTNNGPSGTTSPEVASQCHNKDVGSLESDWRTGPSLNQPRWSAFGAVVNGELVVCGGRNLSVHLGAVGSCEVLRMEDEQWVPIASMSRKRYSAAGVEFENKFCAIGGLLDLGGEVILLSNTVECWDPKSDAWSRLAEFPTVAYAMLYGHAAAAYNGTMVVCGGRVCDLAINRGLNFKCDQILNECKIYSKEEKKWNSMAAMNKKRRGHSMVNFYGKLLVFGGASEYMENNDYEIDNNDPTLKSVEFYDEGLGQWTELDDGLMEKHFLSAAVLLD